MEKENNPIYERNTLEFVTVALEFCTFVETAGEKAFSTLWTKRSNYCRYFI